MTFLRGRLHLTRVHISLAGTPAIFVTAGSSGSIGGGGGRVDQFDQGGDFRQYANGVTKVIVGTTTARNQTITLRALSPAQVAILDSMVGKTCLLRDTYGRKIYGSFLSTQKTDIPLSGAVNDNTLLTDVAFTFTQTSWSGTA